MSARFARGERVHVRVAYPSGHIRTPWFIRGKNGVVERICGEFGNPETLAYGQSGLPYKMLYRVNFEQNVLWPDYDGKREDSLELEIYEHWLEPA